MKKSYFALQSLFVYLFVFDYAYADDLPGIFTDIYRDAKWGRNEEGEGFSGDGSRVQNAIVYMKFLENFLKEHNIKSVVDVGCGDWTFSRFMDWGDAEYIGYDVVQYIIDRNNALFASPKVSFVCANAVEVNLPEADLMVCKEVLQHLSNTTICAFLKQIKNFKHCLITNDINTNDHLDTNRDVSTGGYRCVDLTKHPFDLTGEKIFTYRCGGCVKQVLYIKN